MKSTSLKIKIIMVAIMQVFGVITFTPVAKADATIILFDPVVMELNIGDSYVDPGYIAADDVLGDITADVVITGSVDTDTAGTYYLFYNVDDSSGNPAPEQIRVVNVSTADQAPTIILTPPETVEINVGDAYSEPGYIAIDDIDMDITADVVITGSVDTDTAGTYYLFYNVDDSSGNPAPEQIRVVNVSTADQAPTIILTPPETVEINVGDAYSEPGYIAIDDIDMDITADVVITGSVDTDTAGTYYLFYNVDDSSGNPAPEQIRVVNVSTADQAPTIILTPPETVEINVGDAYSEPGYIAIDDIDMDITADVVITGSVDTDTAGTYYLFYNVDDSSGNPAPEQIRVVNVSTADQAPTIILTPPETVEINVGDAYSEPGYIAIDDIDMDITADVVITGSVDTDTAGTYYLFYNVDDSSGNPAPEQIRVVNVSTADQAPTIILTPPETVEINVGDAYSEPGYIAIDDIDMDITADVVITGSVDTDTAGTYYLFYNVDDSSGNPAPEQIRVVNVSADTTAPQITLQGDNPQTIERNNEYVEAGATSTDDVDGDLTDSITIDSSAVATSTVGFI